MIAVPWVALIVAGLVAWFRWSYVVWRDWYKDVH